MKRDPVCFTLVDEGKANIDGLATDYQGQTYYFCSERCKEKFNDDPNTYSATFPDWENTSSTGTMHDLP